MSEDNVKEKECRAPGVMRDFGHGITWPKCSKLKCAHWIRTNCIDAECDIGYCGLGGAK